MTESHSSPRARNPAPRTGVSTRARSWPRPVTALGGDDRPGQQRLTTAVGDAMAPRPPPRRRGADRFGQGPRLSRAGRRRRARRSSCRPRRSRSRTSCGTRTSPTCPSTAASPFTAALLKGRSQYVCRAKLRARGRRPGDARRTTGSDAGPRPRTARALRRRRPGPGTSPTSTSRTLRAGPRAARRASARARRSAATARSASPRRPASAPRPRTSSS